MSVALPDLDLRPDHWAIVRDALRRHVPDREVLAFGSRATWTAKDYSDLDLAIMGQEPLSLRVTSALDEALVESDLPFRVDIVDWWRIDDSFRAIIRRHGVPFHTPHDGRCGTSPEPVSDWLRCTVSEACSAIDYGLTKAASDRSSGQKFLRITDIVSGHINWNTVPYVTVGSETAEKYGLRHDDIVLARTGASTGVSAYIKNPPPSVFASYLVRLRARSGFDGRFLAYYLRSELFRGYMRGVLGDKSAQPNASATTMTAAPFRAPRDPREQRAIAHVLGTLDDKIELNLRMNETLEAMARALFKSWFVDFDPIRAKMEGRDTGLPRDIAGLFPDRLVDSELGKIPKGWAVRTLGDLCHKPQYGFTASAQEKPVGPRFLRITDINKESWVSWSRVPYCRVTGEDVSKYRLSKGDVLIARMADPGHGIVVEEDLEAVFASYLIRFRPIQSGTGRFLQYWLRSDAYWHLVRGRATGTTRRSLNAKVLSRFPMVAPPTAVAVAFAGLVGLWRGRLVANVGEMETLAALRDTLLPMLISGKVRVESTA
ncbi:MAG: restriction endonuclease subunit S [Gemmatimonadota bacterium]|nr:restriction endonuclease subunit S [Gammaproteobacteria bacterium]MDE2764525.1 restriction endonuclease subunit S [Gemmatimonadota bacterium]